MSLLSPLEQFELIIISSGFLSPILDNSFTQATLYLLIAVFLIISVLFVGILRSQLVPTRLQILCESLYLFVVNILIQQAGPRAVKFMPLIFGIFLLILSCNLIGLLPFAFTPTAHLLITFTLAFSCNVGLLLIGFWWNGLKFLLILVPKGGPIWLLPLIVVIEFISYLLRTFSLSIRLFANMMAGHTLLHILTMFASGLAAAGFKGLTFLPFILVIAVVILEIAIAFIQAYVFLMLLAIYLNDSIHPSH
jgi:F-type H+-transporting ATPase subunit a